MSVVDEAAGQSFDGALDLLESKLSPPRMRTGPVRRHALVGRLCRGDSGPIVSVVAAAGYGKTTLLTQWAERDGRPFAWVSVDEKDNDPKGLLAYVAEALDMVEPIDRRVFDALASVASSVPGTVVPRLGSALASMTTPVVLVLDDVHLLHNTEARAALSMLADHVPDGSRLVMAGRTDPPLPIPRLRAAGRLEEIGPADLALSVEEAGVLLRAAEVVVGEDDVARLHRRTEGWAAGLYLAALYLREVGSSDGAVAAFHGDDRLINQYVQEELLTRIPRAQQEFLTRTSVLERLSGSLCDAVLEASGAAGVLADLARSNLLLVPLDRQGQWYRYHHLFRDLLRAQLERLEPETMSVLRRRAAAWYLQHDLREEALEYSILAGDVETVARLLLTLFPPTYTQGRIATLQRWYAWLDEKGGVEEYPLNALNAAFLAITTGQTLSAERWAGAVDRLQSQKSAPPFDDRTAASAACMHAMLCRGGVEQLRADAEEAAVYWAAANYVPAIAPLLQGTARLLAGDLDDADAFFADAEGKEGDRQAPVVFAVTLCERSGVAMARGNWEQAAAFAGTAHAALRESGAEDSYALAFVSAVQARIALHRGDIRAARRELITALRLRPLLTHLLPHWAVQCRITLMRVQLALEDLAGAKTILGEIDEILRRRPDLGTLLDDVKTLRTELAAKRGPHIEGASSLTAAELRVLPLLATHLTYPEIADELFVSRNTIKSQTASLFRKLGANSRDEAVARSRELALLEG